MMSAEKSTHSTWLDNSYELAEENGVNQAQAKNTPSPTAQAVISQQPPIRLPRLTWTLVVAAAPTVNCHCCPGRSLAVSHLASAMLPTPPTSPPTRWAGLAGGGGAACQSRPSWSSQVWVPAGSVGLHGSSSRDEPSPVLAVRPKENQRE